MKLLHESHQLHFFANNGDISPTPAIISVLLQQLGGLGLVPTLGNEFNAQTGEKKQFLIMTRSNESLRVEFTSADMVIVGEGSSQDEFFADCMAIIDAVNSLFPSKFSNRLSILNHKFFQGTVEQYEDVYSKLFSHQAAKPFEWDNRIVEKESIPNTDETINSISTAKRTEVRSQFINSGNSVDVIIFEVDSNTIPQNTTPRFNFKNSVPMYEALLTNNKRLTDSLSRYF